MPRPPLIPLLEPLASNADEGASEPLYLRIYARIRDLILDERLTAGERLPSSRQLARDLGLSRTTTELAFDQLVAEGYVERRRGAGSFVASILPERLRPTAVPEVPVPEVPGTSRHGTSRHGTSRTPHPSRRARRMLEPDLEVDDDGASPHPSSLPAFAPCRPGDDPLALDAWRATLHRVVRERGAALREVAPAQGDPALRAALATHLARLRSVRCDPEQIVVTTSTQQALGLVARSTHDPGDPAWIEDPGYRGARAALAAAGARLVPVPVDDRGLDVDAGRRLEPSARLAYVTPSHQYPTGVTLELSRRLQLLAWADEADAWIVEDDYDSEFRHAGRPLAPLHAIDRARRVIYLGTFNKILFPGLRLAYAILPPSLVPAAVRALLVTAGPAPTLPQAVLERFLAEGRLVAHLRRAGETYRRRRDALVESLEERLGDRLIGPDAPALGPADTGLHLGLHLPRRIPDVEVARRCAEQGLSTPALSRCCLRQGAANGLILGYGGTDVDSIRRGVGRLAAVLRPFLRGS